jgi:hypothetical protein
MFRNEWNEKNDVYLLSFGTYVCAFERSNSEYR